MTKIAGMHTPNTNIAYMGVEDSANWPSINGGGIAPVVVRGIVSAGLVLSKIVFPGIKA